MKTLYFNDGNMKLYYEVMGEGEPLVLVHGAVVDAEFYRQAATFLSKYFRVLIFDRRSVSRSFAGDDAVYALEEQIEDIRRLMDAVDMPEVYMVGASAGAMLGQLFLQKYPDRVKKLIMFEPPYIGMMPAEHEYRQWVVMMKELIASGKINKATFKFALSLGELDARAPLKPEEQTLQEMRNFVPFLKYEFSPCMDHCPNVERAKALSHKFVVAVGDGSGDAPYATAAKYFADAVGKDVLYYPGYHNMPFDLPREFALSILGTFALF